MSREILLRFNTQRLDKAKQAATAIYKQLREAARSIKDVDKRKQALAEAKSENIANRAAIKDEAARQRGDRRSLRARRKARAFGAAGGVPRFGDPSESLVAFGEGRGGLRAIDMTARALTALPIVGEVIALAWEETLRPLVEAQMKARERERLDPILARIEEIERLQFERRLEEDIDFQRGVLGNAAKQASALERAKAAKRVTRSSRLADLGGAG